MILADIKQYLSQRGSASLSDISVHFDTDPEAMRGMLDQWIRKGCVIRRALGSACGGSCNKCDEKDTVVYQWVDASSNSFRGIDIRPEANGG